MYRIYARVRRLYALGVGRRRQLQGAGRRPEQQNRPKRTKNVLAGDALGVVHRVALLALVLLLHTSERFHCLNSLTELVFTIPILHNFKTDQELRHTYMLVAAGSPSPP